MAHCCGNWQAVGKTGKVDRDAGGSSVGKSTEKPAEGAIGAIGGGEGQQDSKTLLSLGALN